MDIHANSTFVPSRIQRGILTDYHMTASLTVDVSPCPTPDLIDPRHKHPVLQYKYPTSKVYLSSDRGSWCNARSGWFNGLSSRDAYIDVRNIEEPNYYLGDTYLTRGDLSPLCP